MDRQICILRLILHSERILTAHSAYTDNDLTMSSPEEGKLCPIQPSSLLLGNDTTRNLDCCRANPPFSETSPLLLLPPLTVPGPRRPPPAHVRSIDPKGPSRGIIAAAVRIFEAKIRRRRNKAAFPAFIAP